MFFLCGCQPVVITQAKNAPIFPMYPHATQLLLALIIREIFGYFFITFIRVYNISLNFSLRALNYASVVRQTSFGETIFSQFVVGGDNFEHPIQSRTISSQVSGNITPTIDGPSSSNSDYVTF